MKFNTPFLHLFVLMLATSSSAAPGPQQTASTASRPNVEGDLLPADTQGKIDEAALDLLKKSGAPSASIAVVRDGKLAYIHAYGIANVKTHAAAASSMRYSVGSISKQFTAAAILLLAEEGKLSLEDKSRTMAAGSYPGQRNDYSPNSLHDLRLPGLLATGLRDA